ncbi:MAG: DoxX family membrane protein [Asticcacaulis sp.]
MDSQGPLTILAKCGFAAGMIGLGIVCLSFGSFAMQWQPMPAATPHVLVYVSAAILILGGVGLIVPRSRAWAALVLGVYLLLWVLALKVPEAVAVMPKITKATSMIGTWLGVAEDTAMAMGALTLYVMAARGGEAGLRLTRIIFGLACVEFGLSHFAFADFTASMIPSWLPQRTFLAWLTGAGHFAAGIALITGVLPRLAATLEALMMLSFVLLVHVPMVLWHKAGEGHADWTLLFIALTLASSAAVIATALNDRPWGFGSGKAA